MAEIVELTGLPGIKRRRVRAALVNSISAFMAVFMTRTKAATGAGDHGAVNVYIDDDGSYRCQFMRRHTVIDASWFTTKAGVRRWLSEWWPKCRINQ